MATGTYYVRYNAWADWNGTSATTATADTWTHWTADLGTSSSTAITVASSGTTTGTYWFEWVGVQEQKRLSKAERKQAAVEEQVRRDRMVLAAKEQKVRELELQRKRAIAEEKAEALLVSHLTPEQERAWKENKAFFVTSKSGKRFQIAKGHGGNLHEVDANGKKLARLCVHVDYQIPAQDNCLAQVLALRFNEDALLKVANRSPVQ